MLRTFLIEPTSSRGPYDDKTTVTQRVVGYNLTISGRLVPRLHAYSPLIAPHTAIAPANVLLKGTADRTRPISLELLLGVEKRIAMFLGPKILQHHKRGSCTQSHRQDEQMIE